MNVGRAVLTLMLAISVVLLPIVGGFACAAGPTMAHAADHQHHHSHGGKPVGDCPSAATCGGICCNFIPPVVSVPAPPVSIVRIEPSFAAEVLLPQWGSRLFRPPRA